MCDGNEGVLHIPQNSKTGTLPSDGFVSYPEHLFKQGCLILLQRCSWDILQPQLIGLKKMSDYEKTQR